MADLLPNQPVAGVPATSMSSKPPRRFRIPMIVIASIITIIAIGLGGWWIFQSWQGRQLTETPSNENVTAEQPTPGNENANSNPEPAPVIVDSDNDGLHDQEEIALGTDPNQADTDSDGITDKQEVIYYTNPTNADTDGDSYPDGAEIEQGYDPRGPGQLYITEF